MKKQQVGIYKGKKVNKYYKLVKNSTAQEEGGVDANVFKYLKNILPNNFTGKTIVDLGAGDGRWAKYFASKKAKKVLAIDLSVDMISRIKDYEESIISPMVGDMLNLPLSNEVAEIGFSSFSMMYFSEKELDKGINEASRILKNNGKLYIVTNIVDSLNQEIRDKLLWKNIPILLGIGNEKIKLENIFQPIGAYKYFFQKANLKIVKEKHFEPEGVEIPDDYKYKKELSLEKVIFVLEKNR